MAGHWLHPAAESEFAEAVDFYIRRAGGMIARGYVAEVTRALSRLEQNQQFGTPAKGGLRKLPLRRFPDSIVYRESNDGPRVYAIAHQSRRPDYWRQRT